MMQGENIIQLTLDNGESVCWHAELQTPIYLLGPRVGTRTERFVGFLVMRRWRCNGASSRRKSLWDVSDTPARKITILTCVT